MNIIVKGDTDGSIEALADSFIKLSTEKVNVNVISKAVGQISENDVMLAAASDAVIVASKCALLPMLVSWQTATE